MGRGYDIKVSQKTCQDHRFIYELSGERLEKRMSCNLVRGLCSFPLFHSLKFIVILSSIAFRKSGHVTAFLQL
jgi:hypothetical protein